MRITLMLLSFAVVTGLGAYGQARTDPSLGTSGPRWESGKKSKTRDPNSRNLEGTVRLPDGEPAPGAVVKLKNLKTLQVRSYITQDDGRYRFDNLSTNIDYEVQGQSKGMESATRTLSVFDNRLDAIVNLKLEPAKGGGQSAKAGQDEKK
ncbi:MAG: carboxypeptidase regulatory-like domain-containing protein [Bryobacterales bacterium]|nr:carboxypeptidase regulatory-like domain-containing protein [Bryobacterales bacterium]